VVRADGSISRSSPGVRSSHSGTGLYDVTLPRDAGPCDYDVTIGDPANALVYNPGLAFVFAASKGGGPDVLVKTMGLNGQAGDWPFHLHVNCDPGGPWAAVRADGTTSKGAGLVSASHLGTGRWEVAFNQDVSRCVYVASVGDGGAVPVNTPGLVYTASGHNGPDDVYVETKNMGGGLTDFGFLVTVSCGAPNPWIATDYQGNLVRGGDGATVSHLGAGRFEVSFSQNVSACSYTAAVADPGNQLVYSPGLVFTAGGHNGANDVYVETKNPSGGLGDWPFHLAVIC